MRISTEGDMGDACYLLNILAELPNGPHVLLAEPSSVTKFRGPAGAQKLVDLIGPLALAQPYISECRVAQPNEPIDWRSADFRRNGHYNQGETLMGAHRNNLVFKLGIGKDIRGEKQWLHVDPDPRSKGRIIVNRTGRYRNDSFPWLKVVSHYKHRLLFVGLEHEWKEFIGHFGYCDYIRTDNMLDVARLIAGSELFIGNQSAAFACAEGLKHRRILEVHLGYPDTIFPGSHNATYVATGQVTLPDIDGSGEAEFTRPQISLKDLDTREIPWNGWQIDHPRGKIVESTVFKAGREYAKREGIPQHEAERLVLIATIKRLPRHFARQARVHDYENVKTALQCAGITDHPVLRMSGGEIQFNLEDY